MADRILFENIKNKYKEAEIKLTPKIAAIECSDGSAMLDNSKYCVSSDVNHNAFGAPNNYTVLLQNINSYIEKAFGEIQVLKNKVKEQEDAILELQGKLLCKTIVIK